MFFGKCNARQVKVILAVSIPGILSVFPMSAARRSGDEAMRLAEKVLMKSQSHPAALRMPAAGSDISVIENDNYYVFDVEGRRGYVIVSADDRFEDVLGYSDSGCYAEALKNPAFEWWLSSISTEMTAMLSDSASGREESKIIKSIKTPEIAPLIRTKWGQYAPYNNDCKETGSLRPTIGWTPGPAPTGCVATAMAQVMRYHQWPPSYSNGSNTYEYKWDLMEFSYDGSESEEAIDQVAKLMSHCGKSVDTYYTASGSSASTFAIDGALVNTFGYDGSTIRKVWRDSYGYEAIHTLLCKELQEGRPVIAGGQYPDEEGHEFVLDGCSSDGLFHVNWGWNGYCDGYFRLSAMRPDDYGIDSGLGGYSFFMDFTVGIQPALSEARDLDAEIIAFGDLIITGHPGSEPFEVDYNSRWVEMSVSTTNGRYNGFMNTGTDSFWGGYGDDCGKFFARLTDMSTGEVTVTERYDYFVNSLKSGYYLDYFTIYPCDLKDKTTYKVDLVYTNKGGQYKDVQFSPGCRSYMNFYRDGDVLKISYPDATSAISGSFPSDFTRVIRRNSQHVSVDVSNPGDTEYLGMVKWIFTDASGNTCDALTNYVMVNLPPGESSTEDFLLRNLSSVPSGVYTASLYDFRDRMIATPRQVEFYDYRLDLDASNFPDGAFRQYVSDNFDKDQNGSLSDPEISAVNVISLDGIDVRDFTGIENFSNLYSLSISGSQIADFRLPAATGITSLSIKNTPLETISLDGLPKLDDLILNNTEIKELDLTAFPALYFVNVTDNKLEKLKLPESESLKILYCNDNALEDLDVSGVRNLYLLYLIRNQLKKIDISGLKELESFSAYGNQLESLDLTGLEKLKYMEASSNVISDFHIGNHPDLTNIHMEYNTALGAIDLTGCPSITGLYLSNSGVTELKLPALPDLRYCYIYSNSISGLVDLSQSRQLIALDTEDNEAIELKLGLYPDLENMIIEGSKIVDNKLDLSASHELRSVDAADCGIKSLILGDNPNLTYLRVLRNEIEGTLDISGLTGLVDLFAAYNKISLVRHSCNPNLDWVSLNCNALTHFHADDFPVISSFSVADQTPEYTISTANFNTKNITGFEPERASRWQAEWEKNGEILTADCSVISGVVRIPEEAGRDVRLHYNYLTDAVNDREDYFTIYLTREGFSGVDDVIAEDAFSVVGNCVAFAEGVIGEVFTSGGMRVYKGSGQSGALASGIYVVRIGSSAIKINIQ